jgi:hypothetical protein
MKKDIIHVIIIEASMPDVVGNFIVDPANENEATEAAESLFVGLAKVNGYSDVDIECGLEDGHLNNGDWGVFIHWAKIDVAPEFCMPIG